MDKPRSDAASPGLMDAPLDFYPRPGLARMHRWLAGVAAAAGLLLLYTLVDPPAQVDAWSWVRDAAVVLLALGCGALALLGWRHADRIAAARANREPQLSIDAFGVLVRDDFLWRPHRFAWSKIRSIDAVPDPHGVSILLAGELRPLGRLVDITTDSDEPAEAIALRLERYARRPTLH
jgi:hypothetical protein